MVLNKNYAITNIIVEVLKYGSTFLTITQLFEPSAFQHNNRIASKYFDWPNHPLTTYVHGHF